MKAYEKYKTIDKKEPKLRNLTMSKIILHPISCNLKKRAVNFKMENFKPRKSEVSVLYYVY